MPSGRARSQGSGFAGSSNSHSFSMGRKGTRSMSATSFSSNSNKIRDTLTLEQGQAVQHPFFGRGTIDKVTGERTLEVLFDRHGRKALHLDYAKLEKVK
jgi:hypothetical protein